MKVVQVGILIALIVAGVLLFLVYRGQRSPAGLPAPQPAETVQQAPAAIPQESPVEAPPPRAAEKPSPAPLARQPLKPTRIAETGKPESVAVDPPVEVAASAPPPERPPAAIDVSEPSPTAPVVPPPSPPPRSVTIAPGTLLPVRLSEALSTENVKTGDAFAGTLDKPLVVDGLVVAERGARVEGRVVEAVEAGRVRGVASLSIRLTRILTSDGQRVQIQTDAFRKEGETTRGEDAIKVGGGAGIGAAIGAIAGGGKGAAIGAAIGGAAGAGTAAATRGKPAVLPVETRIDFRISQAVTLIEKR